MRKNYSIDQEKLLKFEAEGQEFEKKMIKQDLKGQKNSNFENEPSSSDEDQMNGDFKEENDENSEEQEFDSFDSDVFKQDKTSSNKFKQVQTSSNKFKQVQFSFTGIIQCVNDLDL